MKNNHIKLINILILGLLIFNPGIFTLKTVMAEETTVEFDNVINQALDEVEKSREVHPENGVKAIQSLSGGGGEESILLRSGPEGGADAAGNLFQKLDVLDVQNAGLSDVLDIISRKTGVIIEQDEKVEGTVTIFLKDIDIKDALRIILEGNGYAYSETIPEGLNGQGSVPVYHVMTEAAFEEKLGYPFGKAVQSKVIALEYVSASELIEGLRQIKTRNGKIITSDKGDSVILIDTPEAVEAMVQYIKERDAQLETRVLSLGSVAPEEGRRAVEPLLTPGLGEIHIDKEEASVIVTDTPFKFKEIEAVLSELKRKTREVKVKIKVLQITLNDEHRKGVDWEAIVSDYQSLPYQDLAGPKDDGNRIFSFGTLTDEDYAVLLEALDTVGVIKVVMDEETAAKEREEKEVDVKLSREFLNTRGASDGKEEKLIFKLKPDISGEDEGVVNFTVSPGLMSDGKPEAKFFKDEILIPVKNKSTIVAGGLFEQIKIERLRKVPFLGDIPFLGFAFRREGEATRKAEVIVFFTVEIL